ncbi:uncharacterized protein LOC115441352 [Manduca sexta]|uniref:Seminal fluid protein n=1 Tax=Manduca sexta TaxID=7130 RepID=A0A922CHD4_MANSE|nr:uncharacterized protein LOC115441352 [Manduca sexta]KAG6446870.1 hypothetical protein O3G_MSEX004602 [Manduca sexta]
MRLMFALFIIVSIEAKKKRPHNPLDTRDDKPQNVGNIDKYPEHFKHPVPFGHVYKDGFGDITSNLKQPFDILELDMVRPKNAEEAKEVWNKRQNNIQILPSNLPKKFASPRDQYLNEQQNEKAVSQPKPVAEQNGTRTWIDWEAIQHYNVGSRRPFLRRPQPKRRPYAYGPTHDQGPKSKYFGPNSFDLAINKKQHKENWTSCEEFGRMPNFHPKDIVNIDWVPFYIWTTRVYHEPVVHRFSYPTKKLVKKYKEDYGNHLNKSIDWEQPKLVLKEAIEMLLIAADRTGMFHGVPYLDIPSAMKNKQVEFPVPRLRLKIEDPYLAIMFCDNEFAAIMAVAGNEPTTERERISEAATLKFRGAGYPVFRDPELERMRAKAQSDYERQRKEDEVLRVDEPLTRDHFLGRDFMK